MTGSVEKPIMLSENSAKPALLKAETAWNTPSQTARPGAWSYAAAMHLGLAPSVLFHEAGYKGGAANLIENFAAGRYIGLPILVWRGLTDAPDSRTVTATTYPGMKRWLAE